MLKRKISINSPQFSRNWITLFRSCSCLHAASAYVLQHIRPLCVYVLWTKLLKYTATKWKWEFNGNTISICMFHLLNRFKRKKKDFINFCTGCINWTFTNTAVRCCWFPKEPDMGCTPSIHVNQTGVVYCRDSDGSNSPMTSHSAMVIAGKTVVRTETTEISHSSTSGRLKRKEVTSRETETNARSSKVSRMNPCIESWACIQISP